MKKIVYLLALLATLGVGAVYRVDLLFALGIAEILLWICLAVITRFYRRRLKLEFAKGLFTAVEGKKAFCLLLGENTSRSGIPRFRARLRYRYPWEKETNTLFLYGSLAGGERQRYFLPLPVPSCGLLELKLDRVQVYDWFGLTYACCKGTSCCRMAVMPALSVMQTRLSCLSPSGSAALLLNTLPQQNGESEEIRQLREYQPGDSTRSIHWKQSARTQKIWVKEFERQSDRLVELHLVWSSLEFAQPERREGFYLVLSALLYGLLQSLPQLPVYWTEPELGPRSMLLTRKEEVAELLLLLYRLEEGQSLAVDCPAPPLAQKGRVMRLEWNTDLQLKEENRLLFAFSPRECLDQLSRFTLRL